jgi:hypothetical protein
MTDLPFWGIAAVQIWICTRDFSFVQRRLTGDAKRDEEHVALELARYEIGLPSSECDLSEVYEKRSLVVSKEQAIEELLTKLRLGELKALGVKCEPKNEGNPVSDTAEDIPTCCWAYLRFRPFPRGLEGRYAAFYEDNGFPSWRHVVCSGATVRQLWPAEPGSEVALSNREHAARTFLEGWFKVRTTDYGAWLAAIRHVAKNCNCSEDAAKKARASSSPLRSSVFAKSRKVANPSPLKLGRRSPQFTKISPTLSLEFRSRSHHCLNPSY